MQRNYLAALIVGLIALAVVLAGAMAVSGAVGADSPDDPSETQSISVDALGEATAEPDKAIVTVAITDRGDDPEAIRDELATGSEELKDALADENVDIETEHYRIREPFRDEEHEYEGVHAYRITVDDPDRAGDIVDIAAGTGAEIGNIDMTLSEETRDELRDEAIEDAMDDARHQADTIAASGDLTVTDILTVDASERSYRPVAYEVMDADVAAEPAPPTEIETGDVSITYSVDVTFEATS